MQRAFLYIGILAIVFLPMSANAALGTALTKPANNLGLIGYWPMNEATSTRAGDFSGQGNPEVLSGTGLPTWTNGKFGKALSFDGTNDYIETVSTISYGGSNTATISFWLNWTSYADDCDPALASGDTDANAGAWVVVPNDCDFPGYFTATIGDGGGGARTEGITRPSAGSWHHIVVVLDNSSAAGSLTFYVDGVAQSDTVLNDTKGAAGTMFTAKLTGMAYTGGAFFWGAGKMDDLRLYNRSLSAPDVAKLYKQGAVRINASSITLQNGTTLTNGLVGLWTFDGGDLNWTNATAGVAYDRSGSGNTGTLTGMSRSLTPAIGKLGQAFSFDGTNDYVSIPEGNLEITGSLSISLWTYVRAAPADRYMMVQKRDTGGGPVTYGFEFSVVDCGTNIPHLWWTTSAGASFVGYNANTGYSLNTWEHWVVVRDTSNSTVKFYKNGVDVGSTLCFSGGGFSPADTTTANVSLGWATYGSDSNVPLNGMEDDVRIYNRALSATEAKQLYLLGQTKTNR
ncbi:MAG: putative glucanase [Parcubacteria bacterium C7867-001]|nr:MAG: putative glucanase [Parcubacteria bacterium C7867-001]